MTPWDQTLANFKTQKASGDPYWEAGEMVPIHELVPYREFNRKTHEKYLGHYNDLKAQIEKNGITDMGILRYNPNTHRTYLGEGNTRLAVAKELGFSHVPVLVYRSSHESSVGGIAPRGWDHSKGRCPADIKPSQIGFTPMKLGESLAEEDLSSIVNKYVNVYGAKKDVTGHQMPLRDLLHHSTHVKGQCYDVSHNFAEWGKSNYPEHKYEIIHGEAPATHDTYPPEFNEHWAVLVNKKHVVDLTRRQFEPNAPVQTIMHVKDWRKKHPELEENKVMNDNDVSRVIREASLFLDEEESFWDKAKQMGSNLATSASNFGKALFSPAKPAGSTAPGFSTTDTSPKAAVQTKLDSVLGQASKAAGGASATAPASTPMHNSAERMINQIAEGTFDWSSLEKTYGTDPTRL